MNLQWKHKGTGIGIGIQYQRNTGMVDVEIGRAEYKLKPRSVGTTTMIANSRKSSIRFLLDSPVDSAALIFVKQSTYTLRFIVHPGGGSTMRIRCDECRADYPFNWQMQSIPPCAFCAVMKQSGIIIQLGERKWEWLWSDWGWGVRHNDLWVTGTGKDKLPMRFTSKRAALKVAAERERGEWELWNSVTEGEITDPEPSYSISVEPWPGKLVQP